MRDPTPHPTQTRQTAFDLGDPPHSPAVERYLHLTRRVMPDLARSQAQSGAQSWPVSRDHCFQRIVLDTLCGGVWYDHIARPAYRQMTYDFATRAAHLCEQIIAGHADLTELNRQSLLWRGKLRP
jgi:hypothetical protein